MQIGIDSFAAAISDPVTGDHLAPAERLHHLLEEIELADQVGLDVFGIGEHHRAEFLDSAPAIILAAAAARTKNIRLTSAVTVLSAADPVRVFQEFATLDLISKGRAEIVAGRGSFIESYPALRPCNSRTTTPSSPEKLELLLKIRDNTHVTLVRQTSPRAHRPGNLSAPASGSTAHLARRWRHAGILRPRRHARPAADGRHHRRRTASLPPAHRSLSRSRSNAPATPPKSSRSACTPSVSSATPPSRPPTTSSPATPTPSPRSAKSAAGRPPRARNSTPSRGPTGALLIGDAETVAEKILYVNEALGGISRLTFQMGVSTLPHAKMMRAIEILGTELAPIVRKALAPAAV